MNFFVGTKKFLKAKFYCTSNVPYSCKQKHVSISDTPILLIEINSISKMGCQKIKVVQSFLSLIKTKILLLLQFQLLLNFTSPLCNFFYSRKRYTSENEFSIISSFRAMEHLLSGIFQGAL